jgi:serine/threonine-protein kinase
MLTGHKPFVGDTVGALAVAICTRPLPLPSSINPALGMPVDMWFQRTCAREPAGRFSSVKDLADAFAAAVAGPTSLGLAKTVASVPPAALPNLATSTTGPTSRGADVQSGSSRAASLIAMVVAGACLTFGGALAYRSLSVGRAASSRSAESPPPPPPSAPSVPSATHAEDEVVSIESLPRASASASSSTPMHAHPAANVAPAAHTAKPQSSFDRNSIE